MLAINKDKENDKNPIKKPIPTSSFRRRTATTYKHGISSNRAPRLQRFMAWRVVSRWWTSLNFKVQLERNHFSHSIGRTVKPNGVAPRRFGLIHCGISPFQEITWVSLMVQEQGHANAGRARVLDRFRGLVAFFEAQ